VKIVVSFIVRTVGSVQNLFKVVLRNLESRIWEGLPTKRCSLSQYHSNQYLFTFFHWVFCELWIFEVCCIAIWEQKTESLLWAVLEVLDSKIWLSFEYKSCSLFNLDVFRTFLWYQCYCGIKVIKMRSNSAAAVSWHGLFLPVVVLVDCFMCMIVLVLRITYDQVVLLRTVLNFVTWQLEKASKCSAVVHTLSLVIWITST
jgi:hypothetical protein